jgi:hypothetical protein
MQSVPGARVKAFIVWEPVLATDWRRPGSAQTTYVADERAVHYWDGAHRLSAMLGGRGNLSAVAVAEKVGFAMRAVIWDAALVYPPGTKWGTPAALLVAPVVKYRADLQGALEAPRQSDAYRSR